MEDDPDAWRKPWVYDVWHREYMQSQEEYERELKQRRKENEQRRILRETVKETRHQEKIDELGFLKRNWAIWRRYKGGGITLKQTGDEFGVGPERVRQIIAKLDRKVRKALNHEWNNVPDEVRDGTLGVEFVFRNEVTFAGWNGDRDRWDQVEPTENGSVYWPPTPEWRTASGEQDTRPAKPRKVYTYYKTIIHEGVDDE